MEKFTEMPRKVSLTNEDRLEKKRLSERNRMDKIRNDPARYAQWQARRKQNYIKNKKEFKILPLGIFPPWHQDKIKQKSKHKFKKCNIKTAQDQLTASAGLIKLEIKCENSYSGSSEDYDPLNDQTEINPSVLESLNPVYSSKSMKPESSSENLGPIIIPEVLIPQKSLEHTPNCDAPQRNIAPEQSCTDSNKPPPWLSLFKEFESRIRKEFEEKDKKIEQLKLRNVALMKEIKMLLHEKEIKSEQIKCLYCDRNVN